MSFLKLLYNPLLGLGAVAKFVNKAEEQGFRVEATPLQEGILLRELQFFTHGTPLLLW
ncbi:MAG: hypothetical protein Q7J85_11860 [Bacillota bacterium]|nr:hypothetical protein [Bacillota bacterium]